MTTSCTGPEDDESNLIDVNDVNPDELNMIDADVAIPSNAGVTALVWAEDSNPIEADGLSGSVPKVASRMTSLVSPAKENASLVTLAF